MAEEHEQPEKISYGQPDYALLHPILDTWLEEWGVKEMWYDYGVNRCLSLEEHQGLMEKIHRQVGQQIGESLKLARPALREKLSTYLSEQQIALSEAEQDTLFRALLAELYGLGPLEFLLSDDEVQDIIVNGPQEILVVRQGRRVKVDVTFEHLNHLLFHINMIFVPLGKLVNWFSPVGQTRLYDGSFVCAVVPPVAFSKPSMTIRKLRKDWFTMEDLLRFKSVSQEMADFLAACMQTDLNVVVAGSARSGKTTLLNILTSFIRDDEHIVTVEDMATIQVRKEHVISLESRPPLSVREGEITVSDLLQTTTWMHTDRIIVGELKGSEVLEVLRLMERGYTVMTLMHAENHENALDRLEMLVKFHNPELPTPYLRTFIGSAVDIIVQANRLSDGSRKITSVVEVQPVRGGDYTIHPIFTFQQTGPDERGKIMGEFRSNPVSERLAQRFRAYGIFLPGLMQAEGE